VPADVLMRLEQALMNALGEPSFREAAEKQGRSRVTGSCDEFADLLASETAKWKPVIKSPGFQLN
jgi:tripartite-type tricarboxylate transporter receptor subunit TctC